MKIKQFGPTCSYYCIAFIGNQLHMEGYKTLKEIKEKIGDAIYRDKKDGRTRVGECFDIYRLMKMISYMLPECKAEVMNINKVCFEKQGYFYIIPVKGKTPGVPHFVVLFFKGRKWFLYNEKKGKCKKICNLMRLIDSNENVNELFDWEEYHKMKSNFTRENGNFRKKLEQKIYFMKSKIKNEELFSMIYGFEKESFERAKLQKNDIQDVNLKGYVVVIKKGEESEKQK